MTAQLSMKAPIPAHVPKALVYDFDFILDEGLTTDPHERIRQVIAEAPGIFYTPRHGGHWIAARYKAIYDISRNTEVFSSRKMGIPPIEDEPLQIPINLDPPQHGIYRQVLNQAFSPKAIQALEVNIRKLAGELIGKVADQGGCEFVSSVAEPLPVSIFLKLAGMPLERLGEFRQWVWDLLGGGADVQLRTRTAEKIIAAMSEIIVARQKKREDDVISRLIDADIGGRPPTFEELQSYCLLLFVGGLDTLVNGMSYGVRHMARDQATQALLRAQPERIPDAVEEFLRRYTFTSPARIVAKDAVYEGVPFKANERVLLLLAAGDLDPAGFPEPEKFDLDRENKSHLAFNVGPHRCVGSHLARLELRILYEEWLKRIPAFRLDPAKPARFHGGHVMGCDELHLLWTA